MSVNYRNPRGMPKWRYKWEKMEQKAGFEHLDENLMKWIDSGEPEIDRRLHNWRRLHYCSERKFFGRLSMWGESKSGEFHYVWQYDAIFYHQMSHIMVQDGTTFFRDPGRNRPAFISPGTAVWCSFDFPEPRQLFLVHLISSGEDAPRWIDFLALSSLPACLFFLLTVVAFVDSGGGKI